MTDRVLFLIESGKALDLVRAHAQEVLRVRKEVLDFAKELGSERVTTNRCTGVLFGVVFSGDKHADFSKPDSKSGVSRPKKGTEWAKRFAAQEGYADPSETIEQAFGVPMSISYSGQNGIRGSTMLGHMVHGCGFECLSVDGPYVLWIPDVAGAVADCEANGYTVDAQAKSFKMDIPGCRRIEDEEWDILVAEHALAKKRKAREAQAELASA